MNQAGAGWPEKPEDFALVYIERHGVDGYLIAEFPCEVLRFNRTGQPCPALGTAETSNKRSRYGETYAKQGKDPQGAQLILNPDF